VNPLPALITGANSVCVGATTTLSSMTAGGTWSVGGTTVSVTAGIVTGMSTGTAPISYTLVTTGCSTVTTVTVHPLPPPITGTAQACIGTTTTLFNTVTSGSWTTGSAIASVFPLSATSSEITGTSAGTAVITYATGTGCTTYKTVTILPIPTITGGPDVCVGMITTLSTDVSAGLWSSPGSSGILSVSPGTGAVTGITIGIATVSYIAPTGCMAVTAIHVNPLPPPITGAGQICGNETLTLSNASLGGIWSSGNTSMATVDPYSGVVTGIGGGHPAISYTVGGCAAVTTVTVNPLPGPIGGIRDLCAWGDNTTVSNTVPGGMWTSHLIVVTTAGYVRSYAPGIGTITYTLPTGCRITARLTVNPNPLPITGTARACIGLTTTLSDATPGGVWSSSNVAVAAPVIVGGVVTGIATGLSLGTSIISYTLPTGCAETQTVTVSSPPSAIAGAGSVCAGSSTIFSNTTAGGVWTSSSAAIAVIGSTTVPMAASVTGASAGTARITYTMGAGCMATKTITVLASPGIFAVTGGGNYCTGTSGVHLGVSGSTSGASYVLYNGTSPADTLPGSGITLDYGLFTTAGTYAVYATHNTSGCVVNMTGSASIITIPSVVPAVNVAASPGTTL
jgi:uncharacterized protein YjdB